MVESVVNRSIGSLFKKWLSISIISDFLLSLGLTVLLYSILYKSLSLQLYWAILLWGFCFISLLLIHQSWKITLKELARFLNKTFPEMQESTGLLLMPYKSMNRLEKMQVAKLEKVITSLPTPAAWIKKLQFAGFVMTGSLIIGLIIVKIPYSLKWLTVPGKSYTDSRKLPVLIPEKIPLSIASISIKITPPAYTGNNSRQQDRCNLLVEENAEVEWIISTSEAVKELKFIFNDSISISLKPLNDKQTSWSFSKRIKTTGYYQVLVGTQLSELYKIEAIPDLPPVIRIQSPKPYVVIDFGQPQKVMVTVNLADDYGLAFSGIVATIASGSGEAVKFKEQQLSFLNFAGGRKSYELNRLLDLPALGLQPGDELYYYVLARDNHGQENRSDIYIIYIPDTAQLMSLEGLANGVNLVPEYFRSQRQIIIETEQLIREKDTIPIQQFNNRSNNLGMDQKLLRLRYGKFLGEESDNKIGGEEGHDHDVSSEKAHTDRSVFGNATEMLSAITHTHDNAEDASFFEPQLKAQLKLTLAEMWKAELQLRTSQPRQALPFEYKALRLLKDLQQKSRVYVAKTSVKTTPLKVENRLTGDLGKIMAPVVHNTIEKTKDPAEPMRLSIPILELLKSSVILKKEQIDILKQASKQLSQAGYASPRLFMESVEAVRRILQNIEKPVDIKTSDLEAAENAFQKILPAYQKMPAASKVYYPEELSSDYFKNLNRLRQ